MTDKEQFLELMEKYNSSRTENLLHCIEKKRINRDKREFYTVTIVFGDNKNTTDLRNEINPLNMKITDSSFDLCYKKLMTVITQLIDAHPH